MVSNDQHFDHGNFQRVCNNVRKEERPAGVFYPNSSNCYLLHILNVALHLVVTMGAEIGKLATNNNVTTS